MHSQTAASTSSGVASTTAVGIQVTGLIVDRPGGLPWAFLPASAAVALAAVVAARPAGSLNLALARPTP